MRKLGFLTLAVSGLASALSCFLLRRPVFVSAEVFEDARERPIGMALAFPGRLSEKERAKLKQAFAKTSARVIFADEPVGDA